VLMFIAAGAFTHLEGQSPGPGSSKKKHFSYLHTLSDSPSLTEIPDCFNSSTSPLLGWETYDDSLRNYKISDSFSNLFGHNLQRRTCRCHHLLCNFKR